MQVLEQGVSDYEDAVLSTPGPDRLLQARRARRTDDRRQQGHEQRDDHRRHLRPARRRRGTTRRPRSASTASSDSGSDPAEPVGHQPADGRVLAEVEPVRQQRRAGDGVHPELQRTTPAASWSTRTRPSSAAPSASASAAARDRNSHLLRSGPSAGVWHHYAIVIDTHARRRPARSRPTSTASRSPTSRRAPAPGRATFANSTLYLMSRAGSALFGAGTLDQLAIYNQPLERRRRSSSTTTPTAPANRRSASFTISPNPARPEQSVTLDASGSTDPERRRSSTTSGISTATGRTRPTAAPTPNSPPASPPRARRNIGLRVIDNRNASATASTRSRSATCRRSVHAERVAEPGDRRPDGDAERRRIDRPGHDHRLQVGPRRQRQLRHRHRRQSRASPRPSRRRDRIRSACEADRRPRPERQINGDRHGARTDGEQLRRSGDEHPRPDRLLQARRVLRLRRSSTARACPTGRSPAPPSALPGAIQPRHRDRLQRRRATRARSR